jgi:peptide chain release factor 2
MKNELEELEQRASEPGFWNDSENSQKVLQRTKSIQNKLELYKKLLSDCEDTLTLAELGMEEKDDTVLEEVRQNFETIKNRYEKLRLETLMSGEYDSNDAIITLHAGAGGTEAMDWVQMLFRMYTRWAEKNEFSVRVLDLLDGDEAGIKSVTAEISGDFAYGYLRSEKGVHRLVRISPFDASGRRHTSFASMEVMPVLDDSVEVEINPVDL